MRSVSIVCVAGAIAVAAWAADAAATLRADTRPPAPRSLLLTAAEFSGRATVFGHGANSAAAYRLLGPGLRLGSVRLLTVYTAAQLFGSPEDASAWLASETRRQSGAAARQRDVRTLVTLMAGRAAKGARIVAGPLGSAGPETTLWTASMTAARGRIRIGVGEVRVDRAAGVDAVVGLVNGKLDRRDAARALALAREHMRSAFVLEVKRPPAVIGLPLVGQVVHADEGNWVGGPSEFAYAWARCDATGANCADLPGATDSRYTIGVGDRGSTLRVTVQGGNSVSVRSGTSETTDVVA